MTSNVNKAGKIAGKLNEQLKKAVLAAQPKIRDLLYKEVRKTVGTIAPRRYDTRTGRYVATTGSQRGVPPRIVNKGLFNWVHVSVDPFGVGVVIGSHARGASTPHYPRGFPYPWYHEVKSPRHPGSGRHPWVVPTVQRVKDKVEAMLLQEIMPLLVISMY